MKTFFKSIALLSATALALSVFVMPIQAKAFHNNNEASEKLQQLLKEGAVCEIDETDFKEIRNDGHPAMIDKVVFSNDSYSVAKISQDYTSLRSAYRYLDRHGMDSDCVIVPHAGWYYGLYIS